MFERDYVVRMFSRFAQELARLINREKMVEDESVHEQLDDLFQRYTGIEEGFAELLSGEDLVEIFSGSDGSGAGKCLMAAEIWAFKSENLLNLGKLDRADHLKRLSIEMYAAAMRQDPEFLETPSFDKALDVLNSLPLARWTFPVADAAAYLFEKARKFAKAEDALHVLLDRNVEGAREATESFYYRITQLDDDELAAGGLPRKEVLDGLAQLHRNSK